MNDLISRQAVIDSFEAYAEMLRIVLDNTDIVGNEREKFAWGLELIESFISNMKELPSAELERKKGKWVGADSQCGIGCPFCGTPVDDFCSSIDYIDLNYKPNFCPNCGADMREGDSE